jgi:hypothetical protein
MTVLGEKRNQVRVGTDALAGSRLATRNTTIANGIMTKTGIEMTYGRLRTKTE